MKKTISILFMFFITGALLLTATAQTGTLTKPPDSTTPANAAKKPAAKKTAAKKEKIKKASAPVPKKSSAKELTKKLEDRILIKWDSNKDGPTKELTKDKIISIASSEAKELGYNPEEMDVFYDEGNQRLKKRTKHSGEFFYNPKTQKTKPVPHSTPEKEYSELAGKNYQAVYFSRKKIPGKIIFGGDLWIFIDKNTGEVITHRRGQ